MELEADLLQDMSAELMSRLGGLTTMVQAGDLATECMYLAMETFSDTFSLADLETATDGLDRSSIFRTLTLFAEHHLLHVIDDGSGATKYCVCHNDHACRIEEMHCHFHCEACGRTFCLDHTHIPVIRYPAGYDVRRINYLITGLCPDCRKRRQV